MVNLIVLIIAISIILTMVSIEINCYIIRKEDCGLVGTDVIVIKRREDSNNNYYITFETVEGFQIEMLVPEEIYALAENRVTGRLVYESAHFIQFINFDNNAIKNLYQKSYKNQIKKETNLVSF